MKTVFADLTGCSAVLRRLILLGHGPVGSRHCPCRSELDNHSNNHSNSSSIFERKEAYDALCVGTGGVVEDLTVRRDQEEDNLCRGCAAGVTSQQHEAKQNMRGKS